MVTLDQVVLSSGTARDGNQFFAGPRCGIQDPCSGVTGAYFGGVTPVLLADTG